MADTDLTKLSFSIYCLALPWKIRYGMVRANVTRTEASVINFLQFLNDDAPWSNVYKMEDYIT